MMSVRTVVLVAAAAAVATSASAGVVAVSRVSTMRATYTDGPPGYDENASFTGLGAWDHTLPHGYHVRNAVTAGTISANMSGGFVSNGRMGIYSTESCAMTVDLTATNGDGRLLLQLFGAYNNGWGPGGYYNGVNTCNAYFRVTNTVTNAVVFDLFNDAVSTISGGERSDRTWGAQNFNIALADGSYRLDVVCHGVNGETAGGGSGMQGIGSVRFGITLVPAPGASAALVGGLLVATRRRRA